jgi:hypothetical protein
MNIKKPPIKGVYYFIFQQNVIFHSCFVRLNLTTAIQNIKNPQGKGGGYYFV